MTIRFIAVGPNVWGRGDTINEAVKAMKSNGGRINEWYVKRVDADVTNEEPFVDQMGAIRWWLLDDADVATEPVVVAFKIPGKAALYGEALELPDNRR